MKILARGLTLISRMVLRVRYHLKAASGMLNRVDILPFKGYGSDSIYTVKGRVVEHKPIRPISETDAFWKNLWNMYMRLTRMPIPGTKVACSIGGRRVETRTDEQGFFEFRFAPKEPPTGRYWQYGFLELRSSRFLDKGRRFSAQVLVPPMNARHAVISDIDDTVVPTQATNFFRMMQSLFLKNARTRLPFPGVAAFYRALHEGREGEPLNPILYVSRGPWNLYDVLSDFFNLHGIPIGPVIYLRDWGFSREGLKPASVRGHKFQLISNMLEAYRRLPFILIGDSGQKDPEIYTEVVRTHPGRIKCVYIRRVDGSILRDRAIARLAEQIEADGSMLVLEEDTMEMARHAAEQGWIEPVGMEDVAGEKMTGEDPPPLAETADQKSSTPSGKSRITE